VRRFEGKGAVVTGAGRGMGRATDEPIEIAKPILFMCSDDASFMTGALMVVDGAFSVGLPVPNQLTGPLVPDAVR
jgi:NAD(P)-dependent dehydrogenase (short-subunit alcohol dehydrogenase family)